MKILFFRASGTIRAFAEVKSRDLKIKELYASLGFSTLIRGLIPPGAELVSSDAPNSSAESVVTNTDNPAEVAGGANPIVAATPLPNQPTPNVSPDTTAKYSFLTRSF